MRPMGSRAVLPPFCGRGGNSDRSLFLTCRRPLPRRESFLRRAALYVLRFQAPRIIARTAPVHDPGHLRDRCRRGIPARRFHQVDIARQIPCALFERGTCQRVTGLERAAPRLPGNPLSLPFGPEDTRPVEHAAEQCCEDLATLRAVDRPHSVDRRRNALGDRHVSRHGHDIRPGRVGPQLRRRNAHAQSRKRSRSARDGDQVDLARPPAGVANQISKGRCQQPGRTRDGCNFPLVKHAIVCKGSDRGPALRRFDGHSMDHWFGVAYGKRMCCGSEAPCSMAGSPIKMHHVGLRRQADLA